MNQISVTITGGFLNVDNHYIKSYNYKIQKLKIFNLNGYYHLEFKTSKMNMIQGRNLKRQIDTNGPTSHHPDTMKLNQTTIDHSEDRWYCKGHFKLAQLRYSLSLG